MMTIRNKKLLQPLRFFSFESETAIKIKVSTHPENFDFYLKRHVSEFNEALAFEKACLPVDYAISAKKMKKRIERCCLLFKNPMGIIQALEDLKNLGKIVRRFKPFLAKIYGFTGLLSSLKFDLDHVFLIKYKLNDESVIEIKGFHVDYLGEVATLGIEEAKRLQVHKISKYVSGVELVLLELDNCYSEAKTLFPHDWDWQKCLDILLEAFSNIIQGETLIAKNGTLRVRGLAMRNIVIEFIIDKKKELVITFYPAKEQNKRRLPWNLSY